MVTYSGMSLTGYKQVRYKDFITNITLCIHTRTVTWESNIYVSVIYHQTFQESISVYQPKYDRKQNNTCLGVIAVHVQLFLKIDISPTNLISSTHEFGSIIPDTLCQVHALR